MLHDKTELQPFLNWQLFWRSSKKLVAFLGVFFQAWYVDFPLPGNFYVCACEGTPSASSKYNYYYDPLHGKGVACTPHHRWRSLLCGTQGGDECIRRTCLPIHRYTKCWCIKHETSNKYYKYCWTRFDDTTTTLHEFTIMITHGLLLEVYVAR